MTVGVLVVAGGFSTGEAAAWSIDFLWESTSPSVAEALSVDHHSSTHNIPGAGGDSVGLNLS